ncbi:hypothetical protein [Gordonia sp. NPDC003376]
MTVPERRRPSPSVTWVVAGVAVFVTVVLVAVVGTIVFWPSSGSDDARDTPQHTVRTFLRALADADGNLARQLIVTPSSAVFLSDTAIAVQRGAAPITAIEVVTPDPDTTGAGGAESGGPIAVTARFRSGTEPVEVTYRLSGAPGRWVIDGAVIPVTIPQDTQRALAGLSLLGHATAGIRTAHVFPGPLVWGSGTRHLAIADSGGQAVGGARSEPVTPDLSVSLTDAGTHAVDDALTAYFAECARSRQADASTDRPGCTQRLFRSATTDSVQWTPPDDLDALLIEIDKPTPLRVPVFGSVTWTAEYAATFGGDHSATVDQIVDGTVDLGARPDPRFTPSVR